MKGIPWQQIGAFGSFAIVVLALVLWFILKWKKGKNSSGTMNKQRCIYNQRVQTGLTDLAITKDSTSEMKQDIKKLSEKTVEQTGIIRGVLDETKKQTDVLQTICNKMEYK
jgi:hypothetical protein